VASLLRFALLLFVASAARAEWAVTASETEGSAVPGVEHRRIVVSETGTGEEAKLNLALFSTKSATLRVIDNPTGADDLAAVVRRTRAIAGVNGGYFDPQDVPLGLLISDGKLIAPLRKARLLSGMVVVSKGRVELLRYPEYSTRKNATGALQCGPFLVDGSRAVPGLNDTRSARRTFILTGGADRAALGFCSSVTLAELGDILATPGIVPDLKVPRALNLDGGSSSAFWFNGEAGPFSIRELKRVRNFVVLVPK
jgi:exopolysaccharide biosynthesis protein